MRRVYIVFCINYFINTKQLKKGAASIEAAPFKEKQFFYS